MELENLYGRLNGIRQLRGVMTSQTCRDFNQIVGRLGSLGVLTAQDVFSCRVNDLVCIQEATISGVPEKAAQLMSLLDHRKDGALLQWAGREGIHLAVVVADITDSTGLCEKLGPAKWEKISQKYSAFTRHLADKGEGFFVKTNGDDCLVLFHNAASALDFSIALHANPVDPNLTIHQGAHVGNIIVKQADISGTNVNLAYRVASHARGGDIEVTDDFRKEIKKLESPKHEQLRWKKLPNISLKGFKEQFVLWQVR